MQGSGWLTVSRYTPSAPKRSDEPSEPKKAGAGDWSSDDIQRDPYGFIQEQIRDCDRLKAKIEAQKISLTRLGKQSARTIEESDGTVARYTTFLAAAKKAYKDAEAADKWPAVVNGFELDEEQLSDRITREDIYSLVDNTFMPYGMESYSYYFLGDILSSALILNEITKERFYRMVVSVNGVEFTAAVSENDLQGVPAAGLRLKAKGMLMGEFSH